MTKSSVKDVGDRERRHRKQETKRDDTHKKNRMCSVMYGGLFWRKSVLSGDTRELLKLRGNEMS